MHDGQHMSVNSSFSTSSTNTVQLIKTLLCVTEQLLTSDTDRHTAVLISNWHYTSCKNIVCRY